MESRHALLIRWLSLLLAYSCFVLIGAQALAAVKTLLHCKLQLLSIICILLSVLIKAAPWSNSHCYSSYCHVIGKPVCFSFWVDCILRSANKPLQGSISSKPRSPIFSDLNIVVVPKHSSSAVITNVQKTWAKGRMPSCFGTSSSNSSGVKALPNFTN